MVWEWRCQVSTWRYRSLHPPLLLLPREGVITPFLLLLRRGGKQRPPPLLPHSCPMAASWLPYSCPTSAPLLPPASHAGMCQRGHCLCLGALAQGSGVWQQEQDMGMSGHGDVGTWGKGHLLGSGGKGQGWSGRGWTRGRGPALVLCDHGATIWSHRGFPSTTSMTINTWGGDTRGLRPNTTHPSEPNLPKTSPNPPPPPGCFGCSERMRLVGGLCCTPRGRCTPVAVGGLEGTRGGDTGTLVRWHHSRT